MAEGKTVREDVDGRNFFPRGTRRRATIRSLRPVVAPDEIDGFRLDVQRGIAEIAQLPPFDDRADSFELEACERQVGTAYHAATDPQCAFAVSGIGYFHVRADQTRQLRPES